VRPREWRFRIEDVLAAVQKIQEYTSRLDYEGSVRDSRTVDAVIRNLEIIGEAVRHVPPEVEARHPQVPWRKMREMRNILIHQYFGVSLRIIWGTIQNNLPPLVPVLQALLESEDPQALRYGGPAAELSR
jgi:uncharacterized protein with HEPN domain